MRSSKSIKTILKNDKLSADFTYRFADPSWNEYPLTAEKYANWIANDEGDCVNIYMPYETFGQHLSEETGAFDFIKQLPHEVKKHHLNFLTASDQVEQLEVKDVFDIIFLFLGEILKKMFLLGLEIICKKKLCKNYIVWKRQSSIQKMKI